MDILKSLFRLFEKPPNIAGVQDSNPGSPLLLILSRMGAYRTIGTEETAYPVSDY